MGNSLAKYEDATNTAIRTAEENLAALTKSKEWIACRTAADIAGTIDPSPVSDAVSLGMSVAEGDWVGAALSGVSFIPYLGDALAKPAKFARSAKAVVAIERKAAALLNKVNHLKSVSNRIAQRKMAAAGERARRAEEAAAKHADDLKCGKCSAGSHPYPTVLPAGGKWKGEKGNSRWTSDKQPNPVSIDYKNGYPDFSTSHPPSLHPDGGGRVEIEMTGDKSDFGKAREAMREKTGISNWPGNGKNVPDGYTWHHNQDGATMELVSTDIHSSAKSGVTHTGGASIVKSPEF